MLGYTLIISLILPHFWFDPYAAVAKNLVLFVGLDRSDKPKKSDSKNEFANVDA